MRVDGQIAFVEFPGRDLGQMRRFYGAAFGWVSEHQRHDYVAFRGNDVEGGFSANPSQGPVEPLVVFYASDLETVRARVQLAGGEITRDIFAIPGGRRFQFRDPGENEVAVWSDTCPPPPPTASTCRVGSAFWRPWTARRERSHVAA
jgi:predicted enzyme related to lactoylglutathione lyase